MATAWEIFDEAVKLPADERQALAEAILETLEGEPVELSPELRTTIRSRIAQLERGEVKAIPWSEVEMRLRRTLGQDAGMIEVPADFDEAVF